MRSRRTEIDVGAPDDRPISIWIEPWGDRIEIHAGKAIRLTFTGKMIESIVLNWMEDALWLGLPRRTTLFAHSETGELLGEYDTKTLPPVPPGFRPI